MKELLTNINFFLELKEGETIEQAEERLYGMLMNFEAEKEGIVVGESFFDSEIVESE